MGIWLHKCESEIGIHMDDVQKKREKRKNLLNLDGEYDIIKINCQCCRIMERRVGNPGFWEKCVQGVPFKKDSGFFRAIV